MPQGSHNLPTDVESLERRVLLSGASLPTNLAITTNPLVQNNPSIATDPLNPKHIVVSYMDQSLLSSGYEGIGVAVSENSGATWQTTSIALPAGFSQGAAAPTTAFDNQGHVFISFMSATFLAAQPGLTNPNPSERPDGFQSNNGIFVVRSNDGGFTWNAPVAVATNLYNGTDQVPFETYPDLAVDTFAHLPDGKPNPYFGDLYVTYTQLYPAGQFPGNPTSTGGGAIMLDVSTDDGASWQLRVQPQVGTGIPVTVIGPNDSLFTGAAPLGLTGQTFAQMAIGPEGDVYVNYYMFGFDCVIHSTGAADSFTSVDLTTNSGLALNFGAYAGGNVGPLTSAGGPDGSGGPTNNFRTVPSRDIVADPTRPGTLYIADSVPTISTSGTPLDYGDIFFAKSTNYGLTWTNTFKVNGSAVEVLNDDNGGFPSQGGAGDVAEAQALPQMSIDAQGDLVLIWYDTRRDPNNHLLDVYGAVSTDGGEDFTPNFRITTESFDANAGAFTDAEGQKDYYLGDRIGLSVVDGVAYAAWTDTRDGNQNIETASFSVAAPPPSADDRFGPNNTPSTATNLGQVIERAVPRLAVAVGDSEWFQFTAAATGNLTLSATPEDSSAGVRLELFNTDGTELLSSSATSSADQQIVYAGTSGQTYLLRATPIGAGSANYSLSLQSLTSNLGSAVVGSETGTLAPGDQDLYQFEAGAAGSIVVTLTPASDAQGDFSLQVLDPVNTNDAGNPTVLATGQASGARQAEQVTVSVTKGQRLLLEVSGVSGANGGFTLAFTNPDLFAASLVTDLPFPAGDGASQVVIADVNNDKVPDLIVSDAFSNTVSVLLGNGNGTFQAPRSYAIGAMTPGNGVQTLAAAPNYKRGLAVADLTGNGNMDIVVTNPASGDVSVLLGRGDGTFAPQVRYDAGPAPNAIVVGDFNGDGVPDLAVLSASVGHVVLGILMGRGDGTFLPAKFYSTPLVDTTSFDNIAAADLTGNGKTDLIITGDSQTSYVYLGNGDGTFKLGSSFAAGGPALAVADLNGDGIPDVLAGNAFNSTVQYNLGNGDGTFGAANTSIPGEYPIAIAVADVGSEVTEPDGSVVLGPPDGEPDLIVADAGIADTDFSGPAEIVVLPGMFSGGSFQGFGSPIELAAATRPESLAVADLTGNGQQDIAYVDTDGVHVIFPQSTTIASNTTLQTARNLGTVVHVVEPTLSIVPGDQDAYYTLTVPTEAAQGSGNEVLSFNGGFASTSGAGLAMQVLDSHGNVLGSGSKFNVIAAQGQTLTVHVFGKTAADGTRGDGAYTLDIDVLPQVVSVVAESLLPGLGSSPGGPTTSLVITFQGDRLDQTAAEDTDNYAVTWLNPGGNQVIPIASAVYDPSVNVDVTSGKTYPTAVRQTVTLLFDSPLPAGSYSIALSATIQAAAFNQDGQTGSTADPLVSVANGQVVEGATIEAANLVSEVSAVGDLASLRSGTPFLTQVQADLAALLDDNLTAQGDQPTITSTLLDQVVQRFSPALAGADLPRFLVMFLDPVSLDLVDPNGQRIDYQLQTGTLENQDSDAFVSVASNVEVVVMPLVSGSYDLTLGDVAQNSRGGVVMVGGNAADQTVALTEGILAGQRTFQFAATAVAAAVTSELVEPDVPSGQTAATANTNVLTAGSESSQSPSVSDSAAPVGQAGAVAQAIDPTTSGQAPYTVDDSRQPTTQPSQARPPQNAPAAAHPTTQPAQRSPNAGPTTQPAPKDAKNDPAVNGNKQSQPPALPTKASTDANGVHTRAGKAVTQMPKAVPAPPIGVRNASNWRRWFPLAVATTLLVAPFSRHSDRRKRRRSLVG